jgi:hypothetical protein
MIDKSDGEVLFRRMTVYRGSFKAWKHMASYCKWWWFSYEHQEFTSSPSLAGSFAFILNPTDMGGFRMRQQLDGRHIR